MFLIVHDYDSEVEYSAFIIVLVRARGKRFFYVFSTKKVQVNRNYIRATCCENGRIVASGIFAPHAV